MTLKWDPDPDPEPEELEPEAFKFKQACELCGARPGVDFDEPIVIWTRGGALHLCPECYETELEVL